MSEQVIIDGELGLDSDFDGLPNEKIIVNVTGAPKIIDKASGKIVSIVDGAENEKLLGAIVNIEPAQDLHGYDYPWPEGGGVNKIAWTDGIDFTLKGVRYYVSDGKLFLNGTSLGETSSGDATFETNFKFKLPAGTYYFTRGSYPNAVYLIHNEDGVRRNIVTNNGVFTLSAEEELWVGFYVYNKTFSNLHAPIQIVQGSTEPATFSPCSNICPISGRTQVKVTRAGGNLFDKATGAKNLYVGGGNVTGTGGTLLCFFAKKGVQYTINMTGGNRTNLFYYDGSVSDIVAGITLTTVSLSAAKPYTFIADRDATYCYYADTYFQQTVADSCTVNVGSTALPYSSYQGTERTIPLGRTVYGGTLDMLRGKLVIDRAAVDMGDLTYTYTGYIFTAPVSGAKYATNEAERIIGLQSSIFRMATSAAIGQYTVNGTVVRGPSYIAFRDDRYITAASFKTAMAGQTLVYELATPLEYDLTPQTIKTLKGINNFWADAGSTEIEYVADTKLYIQRLTAPTEDDMIANENIVSGKFFMIGNDLYLSTAAIVAGETIVPGTNCTKLSLAEALNNINA